MGFGLQFGKAIVCSDAAAEATRYGFTAVDRPEGFLVLAVASLGDEIIEIKSPPEVWKYGFYYEVPKNEVYPYKSSGIQWDRTPSR